MKKNLLFAITFIAFTIIYINTNATGKIVTINNDNTNYGVSETQANRITVDRYIPTCQTTTCRLYLDNSYARPITSIKWISSNNDILIIDDGGNIMNMQPTIRAISDGTVYITAYLFNGGNIIDQISTFTTSLIPIPRSYSWYTTIANETLSREFIVGDFIIESGHTITINTTIKCDAKTRIIVKPGGKLLIDGGRLTSYCDDGLWEGIELWGNYTDRQTSQYQGTIELKNGAVIENARVGIKTGDDYNSSGGIIYAEEAAFINNIYSVRFKQHKIINRYGNTINNLSYFKSCHFILDNQNNFSDSRGILNTNTTQVEMYEVFGIKFYGCDFINNISSYHSGVVTKGISAHNSKFSVNELCLRNDIMTYCGECPPEYLQRSRFEKFHTAITVLNLDYSNFDVDYTDFHNNFASIDVSTANNFKILRSTFNTSILLNSDLSPNTRYGIRLLNCNNYHIEDNYFDGLAYQKTFTGIHVYNPGEPENQIYKNYFKNLQYGILVNGNVKCSNPIGTGIQFKCNSFDDNTNDIYIHSYDYFRSSQGSIDLGAENKFGQASHNLFFNGVNRAAIDYYHFNDPNYTPITYNTKVVPQFSSSQNRCGGTLCRIYIDRPTTDISHYMELENTCSILSTDFISSGYEEIINNKIDYIGTGILSDVLRKQDDILKISQEMSEILIKNLQFLLNSEAINNNEIKEWYGAVNTPEARYSLAECYFTERDYSKTLEILHEIPHRFNLCELECIDNQNYIELTHLRIQLNETERTMAKLDDGEIELLRNIAEATDGKSAIISQSILCSYYNICYDITPSIVNPEEEGNNNLITVYPNPTFGDVNIASEPHKLKEVRVINERGDVVLEFHGIGSHHINFEMHGMETGIYALELYIEEHGIAYDQIILESEDNEIINMFPNPSNGELNITSQLNPIKSIRILSGFNGEIIREFNDINEHHFRSEIHDLRRGTYVVEIRIDNQTYYEMLLKE